jgi:hypothetical protein
MPAVRSSAARVDQVELSGWAIKTIKEKMIPWIRFYGIALALGENRGF